MYISRFRISKAHRESRQDPRDVRGFSQNEEPHCILSFALSDDLPTLSCAVVSMALASETCT